jgi:surface antigen
MHRVLVLCAIGASLLTAACAPSNSERIAAANARKQTTAGAPHSNPIAQTAASLNPRIVTPAKRLQCVPYAREKSGIPIRGDAWTWWQQAKGKYPRSSQPAVGSVIVFSKTSKNRYGHLAVVTAILSDREILATHANWLNKGRIHVDTPIRDVSRKNDWSSVKVWYTPGNVIGKSAYPVEGFILPPGTRNSG